MGVHLVIEGIGETIIDRQLLRFGENLAVPASALETAAAMLREAVERQFDTEGGYASGGWPPLAASTVARRGNDHPILQVTGALKDSLTRKFDSRHIERLSPDTLRFGSTVPYGIFHQSSKPRTKIPFRPPIALTEASKVAMVKEMQQALLGVRRAGFRIGVGA